MFKLKECKGGLVKRSTRIPFKDKALGPTPAPATNIHLLTQYNKALTRSKIISLDQFYSPNACWSCREIRRSDPIEFALSLCFEVKVISVCWYK